MKPFEYEMDLGNYMGDFKHQHSFHDICWEEFGKMFYSISSKHLSKYWSVTNSNLKEFIDENA